MNKREKGKEKETLAAEFLVKQGMRIIEKNYFCRQGEIDIIGMQQGYLVFVEVKYRKSGMPEEAVDKKKQNRIFQCAKVYLYMKGYGQERRIRFDVVAIAGEEIRWYQNAFP